MKLILLNSKMGPHVRYVTAAAVALTFVAISNMARADEATAIEDQEIQLSEASKSPDYQARLKEKYSLTDEQLKTMRDKGMNNTQITICAQLAASNGQPLDKVIAMRIDQKMGWGKIAKELGVKPSEIGQAVAAMHRQNRTDEKEAKKADHAERKAERKALKEERRNQRKQERAAGKEPKQKG